MNSNNAKASKSFVSEMVKIAASDYEIHDPISGLQTHVYVSEFLISKNEISQTEFNEIMDYNPSFYKGLERPVESVSWFEAIDFCNRLSTKEKRTPCYNLVTGDCNFLADGYRLPTDAQYDILLKAYDINNLDAYSILGSKDTKDTTVLLNLLEKGTSNCGTALPDQFGLHDIVGNVWEWCNDNRSPVKISSIFSIDPNGPSTGLERVVRGGSFITSNTGWTTESRFHFSLAPKTKSRFTGFRVCRNEMSRKLTVSLCLPSLDSVAYHKQCSPLDAESENILLFDSNGDAISGVKDWPARRGELLKKWQKVLNSPLYKKNDFRPEKILQYTCDSYSAELLKIQIESSYQQKILILMPSRPICQPVPIVLVPYYDVDAAAARELGGRHYWPLGTTSYAHLAAEQGFAAVGIQWFAEAYGESYDESIANLQMLHPNTTGLGKWISDQQRVLDYLLSLPEFEKSPVGIIGHSLGAKLSLYSLAFDDRIKVGVCSEPGIGIEFSNYDEYWYLGDVIKSHKNLNQHELLAIIAPRPFLLIAGDSADSDKSLKYLSMAGGVYNLYGCKNKLGFFNHRAGHAPTPKATQLSFEWLRNTLLDSHICSRPKL